MFDTGHLWFVRQMVDEGLIEGTPLVQLCTGIPYGAPTDRHSWPWSAICRRGRCGAPSRGRMQMPWAAAAVLGGNIVGLEDNLYLERAHASTRSCGEGAWSGRADGRTPDAAGVRNVWRLECLTNHTDG